MSRAADELNQVIAAVRRSFPLRDLVLPDEFFPAHLSVALIDAVFGSKGKHNDGTVPASERYCRWAGIARTRANRWDKPSPEVQESLTNMIGRFDELGLQRMIGEVFRTRQLLPDAKFARVEFVLRAARKLRHVGIEVLQDVQARSCEQIEPTLGDCAGFGEAAIRMFLMYAGSDDFVRGDDYVRQFVADALGRTEVSAAMAERLVRRSAYELVLSPRYLDAQIWRRHSAWPMVAGEHLEGRFRTTGQDSAEADLGSSNSPQVVSR